jgi:hypothetical protein
MTCCWDDLLQVAGSLRRGWVTASLLISRLQSYRRQNALTRALQEYGRLIKTIFILRYLESMQRRRRINSQLNKWKAIKYNDVVANAVIFQNVVDQTAILLEFMDEGYPIAWQNLAALSPYLTAHMKRFGDYVIDLEAVPQPLRDDLKL